MRTGDKFTWLRKENSHEFGEECQVMGVNGNLMDYRFVNRPGWKSVRCPLNWFDGQKEYSKEEISEIRMRWKKRRRLFRDF